MKRKAWILAGVAALAVGISSSAFAYPCTVRPSSTATEHGMIAGQKYDCPLNPMGRVGVASQMYWLVESDTGQKHLAEYSDITTWPLNAAAAPPPAVSPPQTGPDTVGNQNTTQTPDPSQETAPPFASGWALFSVYFAAWLILSAATRKIYLGLLEQAASQKKRDALWENNKHKYIFNSDVGEWRQISTQGSNEHVNVDGRPRSKRYADDNTAYAVAQGGTIGASCTFIMWLGILSTQYIIVYQSPLTFFNLIQIAFFGVLITPVGFVGAFGGYRTFCRARVIDPPAVLPAMENHGPPVGNMPDTGDAVALPDWEPNR